MKTTILSLTFTSMFALFGPHISNAQSTAFAHQGVVTEYGNFANGIYDFQFALYDAPVLSNQIGAPIERADVQVVDGLFAVSLDFGAAAFNGQRRWVEMRVRPGASTGAYTPFTPRQELAPTPYALYAYKAASVVSNQVVKSLNSLKDDVTLVAGTNVTLNTIGNSIVIAAPGGAPESLREFRTPGANQFTVPTGVSRLLVEAWGAGGGGAGAQYNWGGGGGGAGGYSRASIRVIGGQTYVVLVGTGGAGGPNNTTDGARGGASGIQAPDGTVLVTADGGEGGRAPIVCCWAAGGAGGAGDPNAPLQRTGGSGSAGANTRIGGSGGRGANGTIEPIGVSGGTGGTYPTPVPGFPGGHGYVLITW